MSVVCPGFNVFRTLEDSHPSLSTLYKHDSTSSVGSDQHKCQLLSKFLPIALCPHFLMAERMCFFQDNSLSPAFQSCLPLTGLPGYGTDHMARVNFILSLNNSIFLAVQLILYSQRAFTYRLSLKLSSFANVSMIPVT